MRLPFLPEADDELDWEMTVLEATREGWGLKLLDEVVAITDLAADNPNLGQRLADLPDKYDIRRFPIRRFHCLVIVALIEGERTVVAVAPGRKKPGYWRERLR